MYGRIVPVFVAGVIVLYSIVHVVASMGGIFNGRVRFAVPIKEAGYDDGGRMKHDGFIHVEDHYWGKDGGTVSIKVRVFFSFAHDLDGDDNAVHCS